MTRSCRKPLSDNILGVAKGKERRVNHLNRVCLRNLLAQHWRIGDLHALQLHTDHDSSSEGYTLTMSPTSISLSTFSIESKLEKTTLRSAGQLEIDLPGSCGNIQTALDLEHVVEKAKVWVAKQGLCHFSVDLHFNGKPISNVDTLHDLEAAMMRCDVG